MYVLTDVGWGESQEGLISITQIAMICADEKWKLLRNISHRICPKDTSFHQQDHMAFTGGSKAYCLDQKNPPVRMLWTFLASIRQKSQKSTLRIDAGLGSCKLLVVRELINDGVLIALMVTDGTFLMNTQMKSPHNPQDCGECFIDSELR